MKNPKNVYYGRLVFDHLPKTAGEAVTRWLQNELGAGCVTRKLTGDHQQLIRQYGGEYSIICGHLAFNGEGLDPRYQYMTLLREPVDRVVSWLFFTLTSRDMRNWEDMYCACKDFIISDGGKINDILRAYISNLYTDHLVAIENENIALSDNKKLARASSVIKAYDVVGLYEEMPEFLAGVADLVGIPTPGAIPCMNATKSRPVVDQISPKLRQRIVDLNQLDIHLYNEVVTWKKAQPPKERKKILVSPWQKYEPVRDRIFTTPDISVVTAALREGGTVIDGQMIAFDVDFLLARQVKELEAGLHVFDETRRRVFGTNSTLQNKKYTDISPGVHRVTHHLIANLPAGKYTAGFAFTERLPEGEVQELAWYDVLCEFNVFRDNCSPPSVGYACLPADIILQSSDDSLVVQNPSGSIVPAGQVGPMKPGEEHRIDVTVCNTGSQLWQGDVLRPVHLSYHWYDSSDKAVLFDGLRTSLPAGGVAPGGTVEMQMTVRAPEQPGCYGLVLTLVQEWVGWFEQKGFIPCKVEVDVI